MVIASLAGRFSMENYLKKCFFRGYSEPVKLLDTLAVPPLLALRHGKAKTYGQDFEVAACIGS